MSKQCKALPEQQPRRGFVPLFICALRKSVGPSFATIILPFVNFVLFFINILTPKMKKILLFCSRNSTKQAKLRINSDEKNVIFVA
ncbi:MAG: hypothetical protein IKI44_04985, partial [Bacteroidaceae bacterium]|nr:hypothetical protein [Bacteroidaceae bacterium]